SCCFLVDSSSVIRLICQPVSSDASRTFCPLRPMATARFSSSTTTSIACFSSSTTMEETSAGASAPMTNWAGSADQSTMSTRSPAIAHAQVFLWNHVLARQQRFESPGLDDGVAALHALHRAGDELVATRQEVVQDLLALGVADALQDDLLSRLRADAAEFHVGDRVVEDLRRLG